MAPRQWFGVIGVLLIVAVGIVVTSSISAGVLAVDGSADMATQESNDSNISIEHDPFATQQVRTTTDSGRTFTSEVLQVSPGHVNDNPNQPKTMMFGSGVDRSLEIRHPDSGRTVTLNPRAGEGTYEVEQIQIAIHDGLGEIANDPTVRVQGSEEANIGVEVTGDEDIFTGLDSTFTGFEVALRQGGTVVDTTDSRLVGIAYEGSLQQNSTSGEIAVTMDRDDAIRSSWSVEFSLRGTDIRRVLEHDAGDDVFETTIDATALEPGDYRAQFWIAPSGQTSLDRGLPYLVLDADTVTIGGENRTESETGTVSGTVTDDSGEPINGATVRLYDDETIVTEATTDRDGTYSIEAETGTYDLFFEASGFEADGDEGVDIQPDEERTSDAMLTSIEAAAFDIMVDMTDSPVSVGETLAVEATVQNVGGESTTEPVKLRSDDGSVLDEVELVLGPGQSQLVTLNWEPDSGDTGSHTLVVAAGEETAQAMVQVDPETDGFTVEIESTNAPVTVGERIDVRATVDNVADQSDSQTVELQDETGAVLDQTTLTLTAGESQTVQFEWETEDVGEGEHALSVASADDTDEVSVTLEDFSVPVMIQPSSPTTFQTVTFSRLTLGLGGESEDSTLVWDFGDGSEASGDSVSHRYMTAGTYEVTVTDEDTGAQDTFDIGISAPTVDGGTIGLVEKSVRGVVREYGGTPLEGIAWEEDFSIDLSQSALWNIDSVEYELDGRTKTVDSADKSVTFDLGEIEGESVLTVTAIDEDGTEAEHTETIRATEIPSTLEQFYDEADITVNQELGRINATAPVFNLDQHLPFGNVPFPGASAEFLGLTEATISYDVDAAAATLDGGAEVESNWQPVADMNGEIDIDGQLNSELELVDATATGQGELAGIPGPGLSFDLPDAVPGENEIGIGPTFDVRFGAQGDFDERLILQEGVIQPGLDINVGVTLDIGGCGITVGGGGGIDAAYDVPPHLVFGGEPNDPRSIDNLGGEITLSATAQIYCLFFELGPDYEWSFDYGSGPEVELLSNTVQAETADWTVQSKGGENPPTVPGDVDRLTDRPLQDTQPALTATEDGLVVAWSSQDENKAITAGRDLHLRTYDQQDGELSETGHITDDRTFDERPELASTDDTTLAVWSTLTERFDDQSTPNGPGGLFEHQEIAYAIGDASGFEEPVVLTDTPDRQTRPEVAAVENGWVLAWESGSASDIANPIVKYVHVDEDGTFGSIETIDSADSPALGPDGDGATLAYATAGDGHGEVVTVSIGVNGTAVEHHRHDGNANEIATADGRTLWVEGNQTTPRLLEGNTDGVTELNLPTDVTSVSGLSLATQDGNRVLGYRARTEDSSSRDLVYRLDRGDGWIHDRSFASPQENLSAWNGDVAFAADGESFHSAFGAQPLAEEPVSDVFVAEHEFRPSYAISANATDAVTGEISTVSFEVENRGDVQSGDGISVIVENEEVSEREELNRIDAGETHSESLDVPVDDSGSFTVTVEHDDETLDAEHESTIVTAARPQLSVADVTTGRQTGGNITVTASVRNEGGAVASDVPIIFEDGIETNARASIGRIEPGDNTTADVSFAPEDLNTSVADRVRIDTDAVPESHIATGGVPAWFRQPDVTVTSVNYVEDDGLRAEVLVSNGGSGPATGSLSIVDRSTETVLGESDLALPGAESGREAFETVEVSVDGATAGDEVHVLVDSTVPDANPSTTGLADTVGPVLAGDRPLFEVTITDMIAPESDSETLRLNVRIQNLGSETDSQRIVLDADGEEITGEKVDLGPGNETSLTLDYQADDAASVDLVIRSATAYDQVAAPVGTAIDETGVAGDGTDNESNETNTEDGDEDGPGFGVFVAIAGLIGLALLRFGARTDENT